MLAPRAPARRARARALGAAAALAAPLLALAAPAAACAEAAGALAPGPERGPGGAAAWYEDATDAYGHGIMGDVPDARTLAAAIPIGGACRVLRADADAGHVFEDVAPRLADLDGDDVPEVIAVRASLARGAQLAIYAAAPGGLRRIAATPPIGTRHRWLAPVGAADLDGDGRIEIAYVDRPHLARTLRVWRYEGGALTEVAAARGVTNHRIGETDIAGGIRDCGRGPEMLLAAADWSAMLAVRLADGALEAEPIGRDTSRAAFARALRCG